MGILRTARRLGAIGVLLAAGPAAALETDPYFAWGRPLSDSADAVNAKVDLEIRAVLDRANEREPASTSCEEIERRLSRRLRFPTYQTVEVWAMASPRVDRVPSTMEDQESYRRRSLYAGTFPGDLVNWIPPSPTIEVDGIRFGTDKLGHFFSEGSLLYDRRRALLRRGESIEEAERAALRRGLFTERTVLGMTTTGVLSRSDLEANWQGMRFYAGLCEGDDPMLALEGGRWRQTRPFDIRRHVSPEWDESWQTPIYSSFRWRRVRPRLVRYCDLLDLPSVEATRRAYAARDLDTPVEEEVEALVEKGRLPDPRRFSIETNCGVSRAAAGERKP